MATVSALLAATNAEQTEYLRRVFATAPAHRDRIDQLLALPELYRNLTLLAVCELAPGIVVRAMETVDAAGCLGCRHPRHPVGTCLMAGYDDDGRELYCTCAPAVDGLTALVLSEDEQERRQELADAAWEHAQDLEAQRAAEAEL